MKFEKFIVLDAKQNEALMNNEIPMLFNLDHIVSIKPIRIMMKSNIIDGYWIRTSNNKKYRAIAIPEDLEKELEVKRIIKRKTITDEQPTTYEQ